jgi:hypothetical protein
MKSEKSEIRNKFKWEKFQFSNANYVMKPRVSVIRILN